MYDNTIGKWVTGPGLATTSSHDSNGSLLVQVQSESGRSWVTLINNQWSGSSTCKMQLNLDGTEHMRQHSVLLLD